jgi:hypothetical protein
MFTTGSKLFIGATTLSLAATIVVGSTTSGGAGSLATIGLVVASVRRAVRVLREVPSQPVPERGRWLAGIAVPLSVAGLLLTPTRPPPPSSRRNEFSTRMRRPSHIGCPRRW